MKHYKNIKLKQEEPDLDNSTNCFMNLDLLVAKYRVKS